MKRSDMVLDMASYLVCYYPKIPFNEAQVIADQLLALVEETGMIPPAIYIKSFDKYDNVWEPEND
jgi:hypothetical protein